MTPAAEDSEKVIPGLPRAEAAAARNPTGADDSGTREARSLAQGKTADELKEQAAKSEHDRSERFRDHFERIAICCLWIVFGIFVLVGLTWIWHLLMPACAHWLSVDQVQKLQNIVTGGLLVSIAGGHLKRRLGG